MDNTSDQKENTSKKSPESEKEAGSFLSAFKRKKGVETPKTKETITEEAVQKTNPLMRAKKALFAKLSKTPNIVVPPIEIDSLPPVQENITEEDIAPDSTPTRNAKKPEEEITEDVVLIDNVEKEREEEIKRKLRALATKHKVEKTKELEKTEKKTGEGKKERRVFNVPRQQVNPIMRHKRDLMRPLRTYKDDIIEAIRNKKASLITIVAAEQKERAKKAPLGPEPISHETRNRVILIALSSLLIIVGISSVIFFSILSRTDVVKKDLGVTALVFSETENEFDITGLAGEDLLLELHKEKLSTNILLNTFKNVYITKESLIGKRLSNAFDFFESLNTNAPKPLLRSLDPAFMVGVHAFDGNQPFFIFKTRSFDTAFASMLNWEKHMSADLSPLFGPPVTRSLINTRERTQLPSANNAIFVDIIIKSRDVRVLFDERGEIALLYAFLDKETIVITTNEHTFEEIFTRLASTRISR